MSHNLLVHLADRYIFDASPSFVDLGAYHVPFDELTGLSRVEARIADGARRGERSVLVADSGSGKSSVISHVLGPAVADVAPIVVPIRPLEGAATSAGRVADELLGLLTRYATQVGDADALDLEGSAGPSRQLTHSHRHSSGVGLAFGWLRGELARDVTRQVQTEAHIPFREKTEVLAQAFARIHQDGLQPVVVFDDTDRWILDDDAETVAGFFRDIIRWLAEFPVSVVVAAHRHYLNNGRDQRDDLLEFLDTQVAIPRLPDEDALATILARRIALNVLDHDEHEAAQLADAVTADGVSVLYSAYTDGRSLRRVLQLAHVALAEAVSGDADVVTADHVLSAYQVE